MASRSSKSRILILRCGHTAAEVIRDHGDYDRWFTDRMSGLGCRFSVAHLPDGGPPRTKGHDGVLVTGSAASILEPAGWMMRLGELIERCVAQGPPVLAVCFGAQLAAATLGGKVERNPRGWEIGTIGVELTTEGCGDPLFTGLPPRIAVQATHEDSVSAIPPAATLLAGNDKAAVQAFAMGSRLRAVQFHPEASAGIIRLLVKLRRERLIEDALAHGASDRADAAAAVTRIELGLRDSEDGRQVLSNWVHRLL